jgi:CDP-glucose 4,6-dehydratase
MAAQALVLPSYADPVETFRVNVLGTAVLLDVVRAEGLPQTVIVVTSDKVYKNLETGHSYVEADTLGGNDPYSASKGCAELVAHSFRQSFFANPETGVTIKTARAGNVIGAGDWSAHRLVPDIVRALALGHEFALRHPAAVRPWQYVLEPLSGYLLLAEKTATASQKVRYDSFNFGPDVESCRPTGEILERLTALWGQKPVVHAGPSDPFRPHEAHLLHLNSSRAQEVLGWKPRWDLDRALAETVAGYKAVLESSLEQARTTLIHQIADYFQKS